ncbi:MAG: hypothetical protein EON93_14050 [Burkholderiales bacterium]|nr:MAG: hypothetical protein EON93_14050 [Burkholderiales bacterium]
MARTIITMTDKDCTYTVTGEKVGAALTCFTALSMLRMVRGPILTLLGAGGISAIISLLPF